MRFFPALGTGLLIAAAGLYAQPQNAPGGDAPAEAKGLPPRATPADYQSQAQAGTVTIAAEFKGHSVPTMQATLSNEEYVAVEAAVFGPAGARLKLTYTDFSLRVNGRKALLPAQPYGVILSSLKDPEWEPPEKAESKSKTSIGGGGGNSGDPPPPPPKMPLPLVRAMNQRVQKAAFPEGDRTLPQAGLIFFLYRGKAESIRSIELVYAGPAGQATLTLQP